MNVYQKLKILEIIGKPFKYGGRGPNAFDCYGLVMEMYKGVDNITIPDYKSPTQGHLIQQLMASEIKDRWVESPEGRMIYIRLHNNSHVGFNLRDGRFIHVWERSGGVRLENISDWEGKIIGYYDYKQA